MKNGLLPYCIEYEIRWIQLSNGYWKMFFVPRKIL